MTQVETCSIPIERHDEFVAAKETMPLLMSIELVHADSRSNAASID
jgi:hypothetical protein